MIAAESYVAILREKTVTPAPPVQPKESSAISFATGVIELGKDAKFRGMGEPLPFDPARRSRDGGRRYRALRDMVRKNGISAFTPQMFGRRMTEWLGRNGGQIGHSNGRYYEGVALVEQASPELLTDA